MNSILATEISKLYRVCIKPTLSRSKYENIRYYDGKPYDRDRFSGMFIKESFLGQPTIDVESPEVPCHFEK